MASIDEQELEQLAAEADLVRRARARRDAALSPSERLARVHELCRQLAAIRRVDDDHQ